MELALAIATAIGGLIGLIMYGLRRRDAKHEEEVKKADEAKEMYHRGVKNLDPRLVRRALDKLNRMRKK